MLVSASRIVMRKVSADFCAETGAALNTVAARIAPSLIIRMSLSLKPFSSQVALYHRATVPDHGRRRFAAAALDRDAAARMEPTAGRDIGGIGQNIAEADVWHAASRLGRQNAREQRLRVGMAGVAKQRVGF